MNFDKRLNHGIFIFQNNVLKYGRIDVYGYGHFGNNQLNIPASPLHPRKKNTGTWGMNTRIVKYFIS